MANPIANKMLEDKKKRSPFVTLSDGDDITGQIKEMKTITKQGFSGEEQEVLRTILVCDVEGVGIMDKNFDNGSNRWLAELVKKGADVGDTIKITREGEGPKTKYHLEVVTKKGAVDSQPQTADQTPPPPETPFD